MTFNPTANAAQSVIHADDPVSSVKPFESPIPISDLGNAVPQFTAVIDIGSGSARAVVMQVNPGGGIEIVAQQRMNLNLMSHVDSYGVLDQTGVEYTLDALEDFSSVARAYGVKVIHAVATAALRESGNGAAIAEAAYQRFGVPLRIIDGVEEAAYCFIGAIHGLPVSEGILADIGGGSAEIVRFNGRAMEGGASLPLGSLRIANRFGLTDRPRLEDVQAAYEYVHATLSVAGVPRLNGAGSLVGSGGSIRLLSRLDRGREPYPIIKMHGYEIDVHSLDEQVRSLVAVSLQQRAALDGMNPERAHSIIGGAVVAHALMQYTGSDRILVSGQGLREGLARHSGRLSAHGSITLPDLATVRTASLVDLAARFAPRFGHRGRRRSLLAGRIVSAVWGPQRQDSRTALECAAYLLDIGNAVDYYNRPNRTASIIVRTDLPGFTHRESARIAAILLLLEREKLPKRFSRSRLLSREDVAMIRQESAVLKLADEIDSRLPIGCGHATVQIQRESGRFMVATPVWSRSATSAIHDYWAKAFGEEIHIGRCEL